ncbi:ferredoxin [Actinomycetes bacterium KLBMP 9797]
MPGWRLVVDKDRCAGSGTCVSIAPELFAFDADQQSRPMAEVTGDDEAALLAAEQCPSGAITVLPQP